MWTARDLSRPLVDTLSGSSSDAIEWSIGDRSLALGAVATLDDRWRVRELIGEDEHLREVLGDGVALTAVTDPRDMVRLLFAFAGATTKIDASARVRLLSAAESVPVEIDVTQVGERSWNLGLARVQRSEVNDHFASQRVRALEGSLQRIALEVRGMGVVGGSAATVDVLRVPGVSELPERQREVIVRLARGERVGTIAARMYLSPNTVRNHLSAVFKKFGVHSQQDLLVLLRGEEDDESASAT
jgi:DNA-binding CsgD family transcriptional regulator